MHYILPVSENENETANNLATFFETKINNITDAVVKQNMTLQLSDDSKLLQRESVKTLCSWQLLGPSDVKNIIMGMSTKSCSLDVFQHFS